MNSSVQPLFKDEAGEQFWLEKIQVYNWGTFTGLTTIPISKEGFLLVGGSGSGKSTIMDAHSTLLTPQRWIDYNAAGRDENKKKRDRDVATYIRGVWGEQTEESGDIAAQYLRRGTTWSAIAETYRNSNGRVVTLAQAFFLRGSSMKSPNRTFIVLERELDLRELEFFAQADLDARKLKATLGGQNVFDDFTSYQARFRFLLRIENEIALRLLHKTQSAKSLDDLTSLLRNFMLDAPDDVMDCAELLVAEFGALKSAHQSVVAARRQIATLMPALEASSERDGTLAALSEIKELQVGLGAYREQRLKSLIEEAIDQNLKELAVELTEAERATRNLEEQNRELGNLKNRLHGAGGGLIELLKGQIREAEQIRAQQAETRTKVEAACKMLGVSPPGDAVAHAGLMETAASMEAEAEKAEENREQKSRELWIERKEKEDKFKALVAEIQVMEARPSNIPAPMQRIRDDMASALGLSTTELPFVGELLEVRERDAAWRGAIERVLHNFALSILVGEDHYKDVSEYLNGRHLGQRLVYLRKVPHPQRSSESASSSLVHKMKLADGPHAEWLGNELHANFDFECVQDAAALRATRRGVTLQGQIKHNQWRHEKNDRHEVGDRRQWVLGFDNKDKVELFKRDAFDLAQKMEAIKKDLATDSEQKSDIRARMESCKTVRTYRWPDIDVAATARKIDGLQGQIDAAKSSNRALAEIEADIRAQEERCEHAMKRKISADTNVNTMQADIQKMRDQVAALPPELVNYRLSPTQLKGLDARFTKVGRSVNLTYIHRVANEVASMLAAENEALVRRDSELKNLIVNRFAEFNRNWKAESGGLDPSMEAAPDYFVLLKRLQDDDLPSFEDRFRKLLHEQSDRNIVALSTRLANERATIRERMDFVNESLRKAEFNPGTHLHIETKNIPLPEVDEFNATMRAVLANTFGREQADDEQKFAMIDGLVARLAALTPADKAWRDRVLDVRQHIDFVARERDPAGGEIEVYRGGGGKSGGQQQKLAVACLAAGLRYQLCGQEAANMGFCTILLDEAFEKTDREYTEMAMNIYKKLGFQLICATPMKSVQVLEPFIRGACYVSIRERRHSSVRMLEYIEDESRLNMEEVQA